LTQYVNPWLERMHAIQGCTTELAARVLAKELFSARDDIERAVKWWQEAHMKKPIHYDAKERGVDA